MPPASGQMLAHYRLVEQIGKGGMGVVWKAVDTTLNREVAIKILPDVFARDADRLARFEREARMLASLNHANVAAIYGIHEADDVRFLAMELVEGEDLAQRSARGALRREEALRIALEIAQGLEAAHDKGVIHRDLKPANIKQALSGTVKVLDFGLAKAFAPDSTADGAAPSMSPTITSMGTAAGLILGTAAYMSPEQAKGNPVDRRADIWSFGAVLFEMLTGRRLFEGETVSETLAAVLMKEPDWSALPAGTPGSVRRLLQRCLQRDPRSRLRDIGDARIVLEESLRVPDAADAATAALRPARWRMLLPWLVAAASLVALALVALLPPSGPEPLGVMRLQLSVPEEMRTNLYAIPMLALSPDGRHLVFIGAGEGDDMLYLRSMDQPDAVALAGTEGAHSPLFSPDGQWIAFQQDGKLKKISVMGGPSTTLCDAPRLRGASWGKDGTIVFAPDRATGLARVSDAGGTPEQLTTLDYDPATVLTPSHRWPEILPGGRTVLFTSTDNDSDYGEAKIVALSLDDLQQQTVVDGGTFPRFVPGGFLVFTRGDTLFAGRFDPHRAELQGPAVPVLEGVASAAFYGSSQFTFSENGVLAYFEQFGAGGQENLVWVDREGNETPASTRDAIFDDATISPDGKLVAVELFEEEGSTLWILELARDTFIRLTFDALSDRPVWSPDGEWIVFDSLREGASRNLFRKRANGTGEAERITTSPRHQVPYSWTPDGKILVFGEESDDMKDDILLLRMDEEPTIEVFLRTPFNEGNAALSPDGRWLAYVSDESGGSEIYVLPFGRPGGRTKISTQGGREPRWTPDGTELFYISRDEKLMSVRTSVESGVLRPQLPQRVVDYPGTYGTFAVSPDGKRILVDKDVVNESAALPEPTVVIHWTEELDARVPHAR